MIELVGNHVWQSTVFLAAAGLLTLALRTNRAQVRYWVWLAASIKFLIPFGALIAIGAEFARQPSPSIVQPEVMLVIDAMSQPFSRPELRVAAPPTSSSLATTAPKILFLVWFSGCAVILLTWWARWRSIAATVRGARPVDGGRELETLRRLERIAGARRPLRLVTLNTSLEPGVFGILKPVLLWPRRIAEYLNDGRIEALLAHELAHVRRRDNLTASVHMFVGAVFWFHPLVWWLGARLLDERERACDEEVLRLGGAELVHIRSFRHRGQSGRQSHGGTNVGDGAEPVGGPVHAESASRDPRPSGICACPGQKRRNTRRTDPPLRVRREREGLARLWSTGPEPARTTPVRRCS